MVLRSDIWEESSLAAVSSTLAVGFSQPPSIDQWASLLFVICGKFLSRTDVESCHVLFCVPVDIVTWLFWLGLGVCWVHRPPFGCWARLASPQAQLVVGCHLYFFCGEGWQFVSVRWRVCSVCRIHDLLCTLPLLSFSCLGSVATFPFSFLVFACLSFLVSLARHLSIRLIFSKNQHLVLFIFSFFSCPQFHWFLLIL